LFFPCWPKSTESTNICIIYRLHSLNPTYPQLNLVSASNINGGSISSWKILLKLRENRLKSNSKSSGTVVKAFLYVLLSENTKWSPVKTVNIKIVPTNTKIHTRAVTKFV
jgi:hypothetical protein